MADSRYMTHDKWSSLTAAQVTYPSGRQVSSTYDALHRRTGVNETSGGASIAAWDFGSRTAKVALGNGRKRPANRIYKPLPRHLKMPA